jgi:processive 1,2-diacylglycerol beta-glucosyltransferase
VPDVLFLLVGELEGSGLLEAAQELGVTDMVRATGPLELRDFFAAYEAASIFLIPPQSRASAREILEAMAMACAVACFEETAAIASQVVIPGETGIVLPAGRWEEAGRELASLLKDEDRLKRFQEGALAVARRHDLMVAIEKVEKLCEQVLGRPVVPEARGIPGSDGAQEMERDDDVGPHPPPVPDGAKAAGETSMDEREQQSRPEGDEHASHPEEPVPMPADRRSEPSEPVAEKPAADDLVWSETDVEGEAVRFDPDSEEGFERLEVEEVEGGGGEPSREEEFGRRSRERDRERDRRGDRDRDRGRRRRGRSNTDVQELGASSGIDVLEMPAERRRPRPGALEPGLTLRDLMPFLRPPKTVLLLGASTGNGHNRTASALAEAFKGIDRNLIIREADVLELTEKNFRPTYVRTLLEDLSRNPAVFAAPFETVDPAADAPLPAELEELATKAFGERIDLLVVDKRPDHLVCTHWLPFRHFEELKTQQKLAGAVTAVISEPDLHERWVSPIVGHYIVANEAVRARLQKKSVDPSLISVLGVPVSPSFAQPFDRDQVARQLGLRRDAPTLLFRPGGIGATARILAAANLIMEAVGPVNLLVVSGKNERLKDETAQLEGLRGSVVRSFGFVDKIRDLMGVSDLLITRANPHTVAEAVASGLPMILLRPSPGVEDRTADRLLQEGVALKAYGEDDLELILRDVVRGRRTLAEMQDAARSGRRPDAALLAVERIARLVK